MFLIKVKKIMANLQDAGKTQSFTICKIILIIEDE